LLSKTLALRAIRNRHWGKTPPRSAVVRPLPQSWSSRLRFVNNLTDSGHHDLQLSDGSGLFSGKNWGEKH
jgi:hypothetical protein